MYSSCVQFLFLCKAFSIYNFFPRNQEDIENARKNSKQFERAQGWREYGETASQRGLEVNSSEAKDSQYKARQLVVGQLLSSAEIIRYEDKIRQLRDDLFRKDIEREQEIAQLRTEIRAKSAEKS